MAAFDGRLWLKGDPDGAVDASIEVDDVDLRVEAAGSVIGDWKTDEITVEEKPDGYHISAEGEELVFQTSAPGLLAAIAGESSLASRIKAANQAPRSAPVSPSQPTPASPSPPSHSDERALLKWWRARKTNHKVLIGAVGLFVLLGMFGVWNDPVDDSEALAAGTNTEVADTLTVAETATTTRSAPTTQDLGDWPTVNAYIDDVVDTTEKMASLLGTVGETATATGSGLLSLSDFSNVMESAIESAKSHRDYFRGTTAPSGFEVSHGHLQNALELFVESFETAHRGAELNDFDVIELATAIMVEGSDEIDLALQTLPGQ